MINRIPKWAKIIILVAIALAFLVAGFVSEDPTIVSSLSFVALFFTLSRMAFRLTKSNKLEAKKLLYLLWLILGFLTSILAILFLIDIFSSNLDIYNYVTQNGNEKIAVPMLSISFILLQIALEIENK